MPCDFIFMLQLINFKYIDAKVVRLRCWAKGGVGIGSWQVRLASSEGALA